MGLPLGAGIAIPRFPGRGSMTAVLNAAMDPAPVAVGLVVHLVLSRSGSAVGLDRLFSPIVTVIAQTILVTPIVAAAPARKFARWLVSPRGQQAIPAYRLDGQRLFHPDVELRERQPLWTTRPNSAMS